jgi:hypothetical protein
VTPSGEDEQTMLRQEFPEFVHERKDRPRDRDP